MKIQLINFKSRFQQIAILMRLQQVMMDNLDCDHYYIRRNIFNVIILIGFPDIP